MHCWINFRQLSKLSRFNLAGWLDGWMACSLVWYISTKNVCLIFFHFDEINFSWNSTLFLLLSFHFAIFSLNCMHKPSGSLFRFLADYFIRTFFILLLFTPFLSLSLSLILCAYCISYYHGRDINDNDTYDPRQRKTFQVLMAHLGIL